MSPGAVRQYRVWLGRIRRWAVRLAALALGLLALVAGYFWLSTELPTPEHLRARAALGSTRILDRRGLLLYELPDPLSGRQRPVPLQAIAPALRQATIAIEDAGFYTNPGLDMRGIARAAWANLRSGSLVAGGSTITQQLARSFLLDPALAQERSLYRKLREATLALKLTANYPKDEILALYLNQTYYGSRAYGVEAAAQHYFGKPARDLDLAESALLAGLPQAPSQSNPFADRAAALARQAEVLDAMQRAGFIDAAQAAAAKAEPLQFAGGEARARAPHFVNYVLDQLEQRLGADAVARAGLTITTTLDAGLQDAAQTILRRQIAQLATPRNGGPDHRVRNGAVLVLDPHDGAILSMVGSPNFDDARAQGQVNGALALRQPGSAIKPLTYAAALERGWTPASQLLDIPTTFQTREGHQYAPQNYDRTFHGPLLLREALATSSNVSAVRVLDAIGVPALLEIANRLGIRSLGDAGSAGRYGLALTLGGGEVTPLELTAAYAAFANGGQRVEPYAIVDIAYPSADKETGRQADKEPEVQCSLSACLPASPSPVLSPQVAYLITDILSDRYARMRAFGTQSVLDIDRPAAAKTGTTSDWRDNWTVGYTPDRVVGVWVGNADGQPMEAISGISGAGPVWHDVMLAAHQGLPPARFDRPPGIVERTICAEGGMLPGPSCPATRRERFVAGAEPTRADTSHVALPIDPALGCSAPAGYPADRVTMRVFRILPPEAESWMVAAGLPRAPRTVCPWLANAAVASDKQTQASGDATMPSAPGLAASVPASPALISPAGGAVFALSPGVPTERQRVELKARAGRTDVARLTILVDGQPLATFDAPPYRAFWQLAPGRHRAEVIVADLQGRQTHSPVIEFVVEPAGTARR
ncbi:MAG: PBP1A family penicillin-binding protein [Kouleothrix sp.]